MVYFPMCVQVGAGQPGHGVKRRSRRCGAYWLRLGGWYEPIAYYELPRNTLRHQIDAPKPWYMPYFCAHSLTRKRRNWA